MKSSCYLRVLQGVLLLSLTHPVTSRAFPPSNGNFRRIANSCPARLAPKCAKDEVPTGSKGACQKCPSDQEPAPNGKSCQCPVGLEVSADGLSCEAVDPDDPYSRGQCDEGDILDPAEGGQDSRTKSPVCIQDPSKECPEGEVPASLPRGSLRRSIAVARTELPDKRGPFYKPKNPSPKGHLAVQKAPKVVTKTKSNTQPSSSSASKKGAVRFVRNDSNLPHSAESVKRQNPKCGKDIAEKDKPKCSSGQYHFITISGSGTAQYECKNTRKTDRDNGKGGKAGSGGKPAASDDPDEQGKTARMKFCLAFAAGSGLIDGAEELQTDEGQSALNDTADPSNWPNGVQFKNGTLTDSNVDIDLSDSTRQKSYAVVTPDVEIRKLVKKQGFLGVFEGVGEAGEDAISDAGKSAAADAAAISKVGSAGKAAQEDPSKVAALKGLTSAQRLLKATDSIKKIRNDPSFAECLSLAAATVADAELHIDGVPDGGFVPEPNAVVLEIDSQNDAGQDCGECNGPQNIQHIFETHNDRFWHNNRIVENQCFNDSTLRNQVAAYRVTGGCCTFYEDLSCNQPIFTASNRQDMDLLKNGIFNDKANSYACVANPTCDGTPGETGGTNPGEWATGTCHVHIIQYQNPNYKDPTDFMMVDVNLMDANFAGVGNVIQAEIKASTGNVITVPNTRLPLPFTVTANSDTSVDFSYGVVNPQKWNSNDAPQCKFGAYDGNGKHAGKRQGDCTFNC